MTKMSFKKLAKFGSKVMAVIETVVKIAEFIDKIRSLLQRYNLSPRSPGFLYYDQIKDRSKKIFK